MTRTLRAKTPADLLLKVYAYEGWTKAEGESRTARVKARYSFSVDHRRGDYVATRRRKEEPK